MILLFCLQVRQELADVQAKRALMEAVMGETKQLQELSEYPEIYVQSYLFLCISIHISPCFRRSFL
jgi:hypothetical protein